MKLDGGHKVQSRLYLGDLPSGINPGGPGKQNSRSGNLEDATILAGLHSVLEWRDKNGKVCAS